MSEGGEDTAVGTKVQTSSQIDIRFLPIGQEHIRCCCTGIYSGLNVVNGNAAVTQMVLVVWWQEGLEFIEERIQVAMPFVENGVTHCSCHITHYPVLFQVASVRVVGKGNQIVNHVMEITIILAINRQGRSFNHIAENINALYFVQRYAFSSSLRSADISRYCAEIYSPLAYLHLEQILDQWLPKYDHAIFRNQTLREHYSPGSCHAKPCWPRGRDMCGY